MDEQDDLVSVYRHESRGSESFAPSKPSASVHDRQRNQAGLTGVLSIDILTPAEDAERAELKQLRKERRNAARPHRKMKERKRTRQRAITDLSASADHRRAATGG